MCRESWQECICSGSEDEQDRPTKHKAKSQSAKTAVLKAELKHLLSQPLVAKGVSTRYITSGSRPIVDDLIAGECKLSCLVNIQSIWLTHILTDHEMMLGLKKAEAGSDLVPRKKKKAKLREKVEEDWLIMHWFNPCYLSQPKQNNKHNQIP